MQKCSAVVTDEAGVNERARAEQAGSLLFQTVLRPCQGGREDRLRTPIQSAAPIQCQERWRSCGRFEDAQRDGRMSTHPDGLQVGTRTPTSKQ